MIHHSSCLVVAFFLIGEGSSFLTHSDHRTLPLYKTRIAAYDNLSGGANTYSLQQVVENVAVGGESQLSDMLADAVKLSQDTNVVELGDQANFQIPSELIVPVVGGVGLVILAVIMASWISGSQAEGKVSGVPDTKAAAQKSPVVQVPVVEGPSIKKAYDVSIPYDAAARLAYKNMIRQQSKTPQFFFSDIVIDEARFAQFKISYEEDAVKQVVQKKQVRERDLVSK